MEPLDTQLVSPAMELMMLAGVLGEAHTYLVSDVNALCVCVQKFLYETTMCEFFFCTKVNFSILFFYELFEVPS